MAVATSPLAHRAAKGGKEKGKRGRAGKDSHETPVVGIVERGGKVAALVTSDATKATMQPIIHEKVLPKSLVYTDEYTSYNGYARMHQKDEAINGLHLSLT